MHTSGEGRDHRAVAADHHEVHPPLASHLKRPAKNTPYVLLQHAAFGKILNVVEDEERNRKPTLILEKRRFNDTEGFI